MPEYTEKQGQYLAFIYYYTKVVCTKPYVTRTYAPLGGEHWEQWTLNK